MPTQELACIAVRTPMPLPFVQQTLVVARPSGLAALEAAGTGGTIFVAAQRNVDTVQPGFDDLHDTGTIATLVRWEPVESGTTKAVIDGTRRARLVGLRGKADLLLTATVQALEEPAVTAEHRALAIEVIAALGRMHARSVEVAKILMMLDLPPHYVRDLDELEASDDPVAVAYRGGACCLDVADRIELIRSEDLANRLQRVLHGAQTKTLTDHELASRWLESVEAAGERIAQQAAVMDALLVASDARKHLAPLTRAAEALARDAHERRARVRGTRPPE